MVTVWLTNTKSPTIATLNSRPPLSTMDPPNIPPLQRTPNDNPNNNPGTSDYTPEELAYLNSVNDEAAAIFPPGKVFASKDALRLVAKEFAHKKGFALTSNGCNLLCSRCEEPQSHKNKRARKTPVPIEKRRKRISTRCGCSFALRFSLVDRKDRSNRSIKISPSCCYMHSNGCCPSRAQLAVEKRKAGTHTASVNELHIKSILSIMATGERIPTNLLREMIRPLYPPGTSLDSKLIFNFRLKVERMLKSGEVDTNSSTITEDHEKSLLAPLDLDSQQPPAFCTEVFQQFKSLLQEALHDRNDLHQIISYLESKFCQCKKNVCENSVDRPHYHKKKS